MEATQGIKQPPIARGEPFIGKLREYRANPADFMLRLAREYGDVVQFKLGPLDTFLVSNPDYIRDILVTHHKNFIKSRGLRLAKQFLGDGLLTSEGEFHLRQRRLTQPAFHHKRIAGYACVMSEYAARTRDRWRDGETRDIDREMMALTLAIVAKTLFDADVEGEAPEIGKALNDVMALFKFFTLPFPRLLLKLPLPQALRYRRGAQRLDATIYRIIEERRASGRDHGDLLSMLMMARDEEGDGGRMTDKQLRDEVMTLFLAGHETTANALTWTWYLLSQNPEAEARLHREIDEVLGGRLPEYEDVPRLRYAEMVFAESMRLYPPAWTLGREPVSDYRMGDYLVPAGSLILMSTYVVHRDPRFYPEPERFDPERWTEEAKTSRPKFAYFPFGGGPRVCIGEPFAWVEGVLILATMAQRWRMRLAPGQKVATLPIVTMRPRYGMRMVLEERRGLN